MSHYDSDDSTLVDERHRRRRTRPRYRSPSEDSYSTRRSYYSEEPRRERGDGSGSKYESVGKATIAVGFLSVLAGLFSLWTVRKSAEKDREAQRRRRREFERAKTARRRAEAQSERQRERQRARGSDYSPPSEVRRIAYRPPQPRSQSRAPKQIEAPPPDSGRASRSSSLSDEEYDRDYEHDMRSRRG
ncbi:hypothetical protein LTR85_002326 [Meristemomyces frigidus]|nr:hypothetical protein LTR85_002326 [Meristemomyces frigidus]